MNALYPFILLLNRFSPGKQMLRVKEVLFANEKISGNLLVGDLACWSRLQAGFELFNVQT